MSERSVICSSPSLLIAGITTIPPTPMKPKGWGLLL